MYRQSKELYGTWEMLCGNEVQVRPRGLARRQDHFEQVELLNRLPSTYPDTGAGVLL